MSSFKEYINNRLVEDATETALQVMPDDVLARISANFGGDEQQVDTVAQQIAGYISTMTEDPNQMQQLWKNYANIRNTTDAWKVYQQTQKTPMAQNQGGQQHQAVIQ